MTWLERLHGLSDSTGRRLIVAVIYWPMALLIAGTAWALGITFLNTLGNLWIPLLIFFSLAIYRAGKNSEAPSDSVRN